MSEFLVEFHQFLGVEPEVGVTNEYVVAMFIRDYLYLLHTQSSNSLSNVLSLLTKNCFGTLTEYIVLIMPIGLLGVIRLSFI